MSEDTVEVLDAAGCRWVFDIDDPLRNMPDLVDGLECNDPWVIADIVDNVVAQYHRSALRSGYTPALSEEDVRAYCVTLDRAMHSSSEYLIATVRALAIRLLTIVRNKYAFDSSDRRSLLRMLSAMSWLYLRGYDLDDILMPVRESNT